MPAEVSQTKVRRSGRIPRELPIHVSGIDIQGRDFAAPARTMLLSRHGAQILLNSELVPDQEISISLLGTTARDWEARVVCLCSKRADGFAYGIEFLLQDSNFWGITFPGLPGAVEVRGPAPSSEQPHSPTKPNAKPKAKGGAARELAADMDRLWKQARNKPGKSYAVRLQCPHADAHRDAADAGHWLILQDVSEPLDKILETLWDFECPMHGAQREYPLEARETHGEMQFVFEGKPAARSNARSKKTHAAPSVPRNRREARAQQEIRVWVRGQDLNGNQFRQSAYSIDISRSGACLEGVGLMMLPGTTIEVSRRWRKALFRVVWTGRKGTTQASQIGIRCLEPGKNIWGISEDN